MTIINASKAFEIEEVIYGPHESEVKWRCMSCGDPAEVDEPDPDNPEYCYVCSPNVWHCGQCGESKRYTSPSEENPRVCEDCYEPPWSCETCGEEENGYSVRCHKFHLDDPYQSFCRDCCSCEAPPAWAKDATVLYGGGVRRVVDDMLWKRVNPVQVMGDFYLLDFCSYVPDRELPTNFAEYAASWLVVADEAKARRVALVDHLAPIFALYVDIAVGGELRHHADMDTLAGQRSKAWNIWLAIRDKYGNEPVKEAAALFRDDTMSKGYGGEPWAIAADVLYSYLEGELPDWAFVDRVFTLQHNNGTLLNKVMWGTEHDLLQEDYCDPAHCQFVGEAHAGVVADIAFLEAVASPSTRTLLNEWWKARNQCRRACGMSIERRETFRNRPGSNFYITNSQGNQLARKGF